MAELEYEKDAAALQTLEEGLKAIENAPNDEFKGNYYATLANL